MSYFMVSLEQSLLILHGPDRLYNIFGVVSFRLLSFRLLKINLCHFAYSPHMVAL